MSFLARKFSAAGRLNPLSSNLAIATATSFVLMSAALSLAIDRKSLDANKTFDANKIFDANRVLDTNKVLDTKASRASWSLRGTIPPADMPLRSAPRQAEAPKAPVLG